ncbi:uncharacterized protein LOC142233265 [Haematobia irritans]|uniref:uncharacterized protein LOC142233265 n=1 Tax=Haematobia irritans TaxID=7368 RepID=UPI003F4FEB1C
MCEFSATKLVVIDNAENSLLVIFSDMFSLNSPLKHMGCNAELPVAKQIQTKNYSENINTLSEIRDMIAELIRRDEANSKNINELIERDNNNKTLISTLTQEVLTLRNEIRELKKGNIVLQTDDESTLNNLPFSNAEDLNRFDIELKQNKDLVRDLKRMLFRIVLLCASSHKKSADR